MLAGATPAGAAGLGPRVRGEVGAADLVPAVGGEEAALSLWTKVIFLVLFLGFNFRRRAICRLNCGYIFLDGY